MDDIASVKRVRGPDAPALDVLFVHGLTGDPIETWSVGENRKQRLGLLSWLLPSRSEGADETKEFWPKWLCAEFPQIAVYALGYPASVYAKWAAREMDLHARANNMLERLAAKGIGERPIAFVTHSLGGLLVKEMLRAAKESLDPGWRRIADNTRLVVFLATPHTGSSIASVLSFAVPHIKSNFVDLLSNQDGYLTSLNQSYRNLANGAGITTIAYFENFRTKNAALVVSRESADPGVGETPPVGIDADHISICKPAGREDLVFELIARHLREALKRVPPPAAPGRASTATSGEEPKAPTSEGLIKISPDELDAWLERARAEQWRHLAILGPLTPVNERMESWPESWRAAGRVFRLDAPIEAPPATLLALTGLTSLDLSGNYIGEAGAKAIAAKLTGLTALDLSGNKIGEAGAQAIAAKLTGLTSLDLSGNKIGEEGAKAIAASLTGLASLNLSENRIGAAGAEAIAAKLTSLASLDLALNNIGDAGAKAIAASLTGLASLDLWGNHIGAEGAKAIAASLTGLTSLDLWGNNIGDAGAKAIAASLTGLTSLNLGNSNIGDAGAKAIAASLTGLTSLLLWTNNIGAEGARAILDAWSARSDSLQLESLDLTENGDLSSLLPKEGLETSDAQTILAAYRRFKQAQAQGTARPLNEVKLLVVGNEAVGKTSLLNFLIDGKSRDPNETRTPGIAQRERIEIKAWSPDKSEVRLNVWDFGGQEMMRGTHRFFLTERSLYLLLFEDRREDERTVHDWLKTIRNRGSDSPILVVINKSDDGKQDLRLPEEQLAKDYPNIVGFLRTSCNPGDSAAQSIAALRAKIVEIIQNDPRLKHVRDPIPNNWLAIKTKVAEMAAKRALLNQSEFAALCLAPGEGLEPVMDADEQRALLRVLHELGVIVAHGLKRDAPAARRDITLLDPNWLTDAIYGVLDKARSVEQEGEFSRAQLAEWLDPKRYPPERHEFILDMMLDPDIGLCFRLPLAKEERYLIPEGLSPNPRYVGDWPADCLRFRFQYKFLPPGLIPRFIVQANRHLTPEKARWRTGVVLKGLCSAAG